MSRKKALIATASALITLLICAAGIKASGLLSVGKSPASADLAVRGPGDQSMLEKQGGDSPSMLNKGASLITMPDDVRDWLLHLKKVEQMKRALTGDEMRETQIMIGQANGSEGLMTGDAVKAMADPESNMTAPPVVTELQDMTAKFKQKWYDLSTFFRSKPAPAECQPIAQAYDRGLNQMGMIIGDVGSMLDPVMEKAESDPGAAKAEGLQNANDISHNHAKSIDENFGVADDGVGSICSKYHVSKMFDIDRHGSDGSSLSSRG